VVDTAARRAALTDGPITQRLLLQVISETHPRTTRETQAHFNRVRQQLEQEQTQHPRIGFT
jgi:hypothetical protein